MAGLTSENFLSLRRRYHTSRSKRSSVERQWKEIEFFMGPMDDGSSFSQSAGGTATPTSRPGVWDHTAIQGAEKLTAQMHGSVIPSTVPWFFGTYRKAKLNKDAEASKFRDELIEEVWNTIAASDFYTEMAATLGDLVRPGNAFISMEPRLAGTNAKTLEEEFEGVDFSAIPLDEAFFEANRKGGIRVFWRRLFWTPSEIYDFHLDKQKQAETKEDRDEWECPADIKQKMEQGNTDPIEYVFCVFPREKILARKSLVYPAVPQNRPWGAVWFREDQGKRVGCEIGYYEMPIYYCPWGKTSRSRWGYGPGNIALPTTKYVNQWKENYKLAGELALEPPFLTTERNNVTDVDIRPGHGSVVRSVEEMKPFISGANFEVAEKIIQDDVATIRHIFYTDDLQLKESPAMTATEVQIRYEIMNRLLGKTLTNIQTYLLGPIIKAIISMLTRFGRIGEMPKSVKEAGGTMAVEYQGPLARSQRTDEVAAVERWVSMVYGMAQYDPRMRAAIDPKKIANYVRERLGIPADLAPTEMEMDKRMKEIDNMQMEAMKAAAMKDKAKAAKDGADAQATASASPGAGVSYPTLPVGPVQGQVMPTA